MVWGIWWLVVVVVIVVVVYAPCAYRYLKASLASTQRWGKIGAPSDCEHVNATIHVGRLRGKKRGKEQGGRSQGEGARGKEPGGGARGKEPGGRSQGEGERSMQPTTCDSEEQHAHVRRLFETRPQQHLEPQALTRLRLTFCKPATLSQLLTRIHRRERASKPRPFVAAQLRPRS
eukprot:366306-Chlamydomonas_euryale.AAC.2